jgi:acyl carrier protein
MNIDEFMMSLAALDIKVWSDEGHLRCNAPKQALTPELKEQLSKRKAAILAFLHQANNTGPVQGAQPTPISRNQNLALSHAQERLWSVIALHPNTCVYNISFAYDLRGQVDPAILEKSLRDIQQRHEILRTCFRSIDKKTIQEVSPETSAQLIQADISSLPEDEKEEEIRRHLQSEHLQPFPLEISPLFRCQLLRVLDEKYILSFTFHHLIFDGESKDVLLRELSSLYASNSANTPSTLPPLPVQYADYAAWQRSWLTDELIDKQTVYWEKQLGGKISELQLPNDHKRSVQQSSTGGSESFQLPAELTESLKDFSREEDVGLFTTVLVAFNVFLYMYTGQEDQILCSPVAYRNRSNIEELIGYFNNIVVLRTDLTGDPSFRELLRRERRVVLDAFENQDLPFQRVAQFPNLIRTPLTRAVFSLRNTPEQPLSLVELQVQPEEHPKQEMDFDLGMRMHITEGALGGVLQYNANLFEKNTVLEMLYNFESLLNGLIQKPDQHISQTPRFGVELSAVKNLLEQHPKLESAALVAQPKGPSTSNALVAYVVPDQRDIPSAEELRQFLRDELPAYAVPEVFVPLKELPLTAAGDIDYAEFPAISSDHAASRPAYVAPHTSLEKKLATLWAEVLWLDEEIGIHDNFFDLGGHSLLSVQLVAEIESLLQHTLSLNSLSELSSIAKLIETLESENPSSGNLPGSRGETQSHLDAFSLSPDIYHAQLARMVGWKGTRSSRKSLLVGLNTEGPKQPLFWCFQGHNELSQLAKYLGPEQPVYGMRSGHLIMDKTPENIRALARHYVGEILSIQPEGPFLIGGNCQAASIAFQIALQLMDKEHSMTLLCLQEKFIPEHYPGRIAFFFSDESDHNPYLNVREAEQGWRKYYTGEYTLNLISGRHGKFFKEPHIQRLTEEIQKSIEEAQSKPLLDPSAATEGSSSLLPESAYRAEITVVESLLASPKSKLTIPVSLCNRGTHTWLSTEQSGIVLGSRWVKKSGRVLPSADSRVSFTQDVEPDSAMELSLVVSAPKKPGDYFLELDLVEDQMTWFAEKGSKSALIDVKVKRFSKIWNWIYPKDL